MDITPENLVNELKKDIIGQDSYIRDLASALWIHFKKYEHFLYTGTHISNPKTNILVIGKSGSGKTMAIQLLAQTILHLPIVIENASLLTGSGWKGNNVDTLAMRAVSAAGGDKNLEQYAVIVLDECDKLFGSNRIKDTSFSPVANLLTFISGSTVTFGESNNKATIDTSHMLFIFLGAFSGLEEIIQNRISGKASIGFNSAGYKKPPEDNIFTHVTKDDLNEYGMPWELLGRIQTISVMHELTYENYKNILLNSESSIIKQYDNLFRRTLGANISITDAAACYVAQKASGLQMGARSLNQIVAEVLQPVVYDIGSDDSIGTLILDVGNDGLFVKQIHSQRINVYEQLTTDDKYILESVPFACICGQNDIWLYAKKIADASHKTRKMVINVALTAEYILAAAITLTLIDKKPSMTMYMLYQTLDTMSPDGITERIYPLSETHNDFINKAYSYNADFNQARKTAKSILLDYCYNYFNSAVDENESILTDIE